MVIDFFVFPIMININIIIINITIIVTLPFLLCSELIVRCRRLKKDFHFIIGMQRDEGNVRGGGIEVCVLEQSVVERQKNS